MQMMMMMMIVWTDDAQLVDVLSCSHHSADIAHNM